jgi:hypothetical protein
MLNPVAINGLRCFKEQDWEQEDREIMSLRDITKKPRKVCTNEDGDILFEGGFGDEDAHHKK